MNNSSLLTADRAMHLRIVVVSLVASIAVVAVAIAARMIDLGPADNRTSATIVKPAKPVMAIVEADSTIR